MVFPFADKVDYKSCCLIFEDWESKDAGPLIKEWLSRHTDEQIIEMGKLGRKYYEDWLNVRDRGDELMTYAVEQAFRRDGLIQ